MNLATSYLEHFALSRAPFENTPDPSFYYAGGDHERILSRMTDALALGRGLMAVTGPIGSGKTTLSQKLMAGLGERSSTIWMAEPPVNGTDLLLFLIGDLSVPLVSDSRVFILRDLRRSLLELVAAGQRRLMIIDESHRMSDEVWDTVRILNNLEEGPTKLLQIILLGQTEMLDSLARPELEAVRQRLACIEQIKTMPPELTREYVLHRLSVAGASRPPFTEHALEAVCLSAGGIPRTINSLCERSLRIAFEREKESADEQDVHWAAEDLGLARHTLRYLLSIQAVPEKRDKPPVKAADPVTRLAAELATETPDFPDAPPERPRPVPVQAEAVESPPSPDEEARPPRYPTRSSSPSPPVFPLALFLTSLLALAGSLWLLHSQAPDMPLLASLEAGLLDLLGRR